MVVGLLLIPPILGASVTIAVGHHLWPRFFFFAFGFAALVIIRGLMQFGMLLGRLVRLPEDKSTRVGTLLCCGLITLSLLSVPLAYGPKQDYVGAMQYINSNLQAEDAVVTVSLTAFPYHEYLGTDWSEVNSVEELNTIRETPAGHGWCTPSHLSWNWFTRRLCKVSRMNLPSRKVSRGPLAVELSSSAGLIFLRLMLARPAPPLRDRNF